MPVLAVEFVGRRMAGGPGRGRWHFGRAVQLHPSAAILIWFAGVLAVQYLDYPGLLVISVVLLLQSGLARAWGGYAVRARWLLLSLWLILAYHTPGEAYADLRWAPTYEGMNEANLHVLRLLVMLGCLSWLFARLGREGLVAGLSGLLLPAGRLGFKGERLLVRLSLVLDGLQHPHEKGAWRHMLASAEELPPGPATLVVNTMIWQTRDSLLVASIVVALLILMTW